MIGFRTSTNGQPDLRQVQSVNESQHERINALEGLVEQLTQDILDLRARLDNVHTINVESDLGVEPEARDALNSEDRAIRATITVLENLNYPFDTSPYELDKACRLGANVSQVDKFREWRPKRNHGAPVRSQLSAWFVLNLADAVAYEWKSTDFADSLMRLAEATGTHTTNWALKETDEQAIKFIDLAWGMTPKTTKQLPF